MRAAEIFLVAASMTLLVGCDAKSEGTEAVAFASPTTPSVLQSDLPVVGAFPNATEVRLFVETGYKHDGKPIYAEPAGRKLSNTQRSQFEKALQIDPMPESMPACFVPHHFFKYYDSHNKALGEIAVCFCCDGVEVSGSSGIKWGPDQMISADYKKLKQFVTSLGLPTDFQCSRPWELSSAPEQLTG